LLRSPRSRVAPTVTSAKSLANSAYASNKRSETKRRQPQALRRDIDLLSNQIDLIKSEVDGLTQHIWGYQAPSSRIDDANSQLTEIRKRLEACTRSVELVQHNLREQVERWEYDDLIERVEQLEIRTGM
jgi:archaellum component FlaC